MYNWWILQPSHTRCRMLHLACTMSYTGFTHVIINQIGRPNDHIGNHMSWHNYLFPWGSSFRLSLRDPLFVVQTTRLSDRSKETAKTEALCHSRRGTIKIPPRSNAVGAKYRPNFGSTSPAMWRLHMSEIISNRTNMQKKNPPTVNILSRSLSNLWND